MLICMQKCEYFTPNLILQKSTAEAKIPAKTRRDQPTSGNEVATENWSLDKKIEVATKLRVEEHKGGRNLKRSQTKSLQRN